MFAPHCHGFQESDSDLFFGSLFLGQSSTKVVHVIHPERSPLLSRQQTPLDVFIGKLSAAGNRKE